MSCRCSPSRHILHRSADLGASPAFGDGTARTGRVLADPHEVVVAAKADRVRAALTAIDRPKRAAVGRHT